MPSGSEESTLVRAAAAGDGPAFARLYEAYERRIFNYLLRLLGDRHEAEDATQEAFIKVMAKLPDLDHDNLQFGAYLYTAARNAGYDVIAGRKKLEPAGAVPAEAETPFLGDVSDIESDPERSALASSQEAAVRSANDRLPDRQREVLALRELDGMSYDEISSVMEMKPNAVAQLISRARIGLRKEMRAGAAASVAFASPDCEKAHGALACRQDGQPDDLGSWLDTHLAGCGNCRVASEEMAEAGVSYRAWAPVVPAAWIFREVMAKASETMGHDWSRVERPGSNSSATGKTAGRTVMIGVGAALVAVVFASLLLAEADAPERVVQVNQRVESTGAAANPTKGARKVVRKSERANPVVAEDPVAATPASEIQSGSAPAPGASRRPVPVVTRPGGQPSGKPRPSSPADPAPKPVKPVEPTRPTEPTPPTRPTPDPPPDPTPDPRPDPTPPASSGPPNLTIPGKPGRG